MAYQVELGAGLIAIGRPWGTTPEVPSEASALSFLEAAYEAGIRYFDTAPSYGLSEERLGKFLDRLGTSEREGVTVATKFGEHWNPDKQEACVDHSEEALKRSVEQSIIRLGHISLLQLHKTSAEVLKSEAFANAAEYAVDMGIGSLGASVSDEETANIVIEDSRFSAIQLPYNQGSPHFRSAIEDAYSSGFEVIVNRPFQMGQVSAAKDKQGAAVEAFNFILATNFTGTILTGTSNINHLRENLAAFKQAQQ